MRAGLREPAAHHITFLKSTQVFDKTYAPNSGFVSLGYLFSNFVDFSTVEENSVASCAFFNLDAFNVVDHHDVRALWALYVGLFGQCHSDLPLTVRPLSLPNACVNEC